jgi:predicted nucleotide-binding protein
MAIATIEEIKKIYGLFLRLGIRNYFNTESFKIFRLEHGIDNYWNNSIENGSRQYGYEPFTYPYEDFQFDFILPIFLSLLYRDKRDSFIEIICSLLLDVRQTEKRSLTEETIDKISSVLTDGLSFDKNDVQRWISKLKPEMRAFYGPAIPIPSLKEELVIDDKGDIGKRLKNSNKIFIVHGHNEKIKTEVDKFLRSLKLDPIILHKQANLGKTIIEKVEHYSNVGFAVILLTRDDRGAKHIDYLQEIKDPSIIKSHQDLEYEKEYAWDHFIEALEYRARQNVIFEFGYFIGKLGRNKVAALCEEGIERPSDIDGLVYIPLDDKGEWMKELENEIKAVGIKTGLKRLDED